MKYSLLPESIIQSMIDTKVWTTECPVPLEDLNLLQLKHYDFNGMIQNGEMVTHNQITGRVLEIFQELLDIKFSIDKIKLIDHYSGNDELSMKDNNSSCFNFRKIANTDLLSSHSYGLAIDINPVQNPYIRIGDESLTVYPTDGIKFLNRHNQRPGMLESVTSIFEKHGFIWGGRWNSPIDYHHFEFKV